MKRINFVKKTGVTLIETILYLAIFSIVFSSSMFFVFNTGEANSKAEIKTEIEKSLTFINSHMSEAFVKSVSIDTTNSVFTNNNGKLRINEPSSQYIEYSISNNRLSVNRTGVNNYISNVEFIVDQLYFEKVLSSTSAIVGVRVTINLKSVKTPSITNTNSTLYNING